MNVSSAVWHVLVVMSQLMVPQPFQAFRSQLAGGFAVPAAPAVSWLIGRQCGCGQLNASPHECELFLESDYNITICNDIYIYIFFIYSLIIQITCTI